ncbi:MAG: branched-chain amino acid transport system ATP-binding protein [Acidimicrobiaceae bacterium]
MLNIDGVTAGYGSTTVLRDVRMVIPDGSVVALLGPNGAGKTTLLKVASGLLPPSSGRLLLDATDVTGWRPHQLQERGVCHVPEGRGVFPTLTVRENLELQALDGDRRAAVERAVSAFPRLGERLSQLSGTMSGGEQQMLALARTYVQSPSLVLLDEVSMGLAPKIVDEIFLFLEGLAGQGTSLLLVEQYVTRALAICDYVYLLNKGVVVFKGEPSEVSAEDLHAQYVGVH